MFSQVREVPIQEAGDQMRDNARSSVARTVSVVAGAAGKPGRKMPHTFCRRGHWPRLQKVAHPGFGDLNMRADRVNGILMRPATASTTSAVSTKPVSEPACGPVPSWLSSMRRETP